MQLADLAGCISIFRQASKGRSVNGRAGATCQRICNELTNVPRSTLVEMMRTEAGLPQQDHDDILVLLTAICHPTVPLSGVIVNSAHTNFPASTHHIPSLAFIWMVSTALWKVAAFVNSFRKRSLRAEASLPHRFVDRMFR